MTDELNDGPTMSLDEFLEREKEDSNLFWRLDSGHIQNLLNAALDRLELREAENASLLEVNDHLLEVNRRSTARIALLEASSRAATLAQQRSPIRSITGQA